MIIGKSIRIGYHEKHQKLTQIQMNIRDRKTNFVGLRLTQEERNKIEVLRAEKDLDISSAIRLAVAQYLKIQQLAI